MKERINPATLGIAVCHLLWPGLGLFSLATGLEFYFHSEAVFLLLLCLTTLCLTIHLSKKESPTGNVIFLFLFPLTIVTGFFQMLLMQTAFAIPAAIFNILCTGWLFLKTLPRRWYKHLTVALCILLLIPFGYMSFIDLIFGQIGTTTIEQEVLSPNGQKTAQLINDDQGALGGNTFIYIRYPDLIPLGFGSIRPDSTRLYRGRWGEFETMILSWQDDHTLLINQHPIDITTTP